MDEHTIPEQKSIKCPKKGLPHDSHYLEVPYWVFIVSNEDCTELQKKDKQYGKK